MFRSREIQLLQEENVALRAQLSDRESFIRSLLEQAQKERKDLLDRLMAALQPQAVRTLADAAHLHKGETRQGTGAPPPSNIPGRSPNLRPPVSIAEVRARNAATSPFSDIEAASDLGPGRQG